MKLEFPDLSEIHGEFPFSKILFEYHCSLPLNSYTIWKFPKPFFLFASILNTTDYDFHINDIGDMILKTKLCSDPRQIQHFHTS